MDREQALARFTRELATELSDPQASKDIVKHLRQQFFSRHKLPASAHFTGREVAERVARTIARAKRSEQESDVIRLLMQVPHVSDELGEPRICEIVKVERLGASPTLTAGDLSRLGHDNFLEGLEQEFKLRAEKEAETRLAEERRTLLETMRVLRAEHDALGAVKSKLESIPPDANLDLLIEQDVAPHSADLAPVWWKELGLESDPFSSNRGLSGIPEKKYDDVVVRTPFFESQIRRLSERPDDLFGKTVVILGEFGSGKTTLFQVLGSRAATLGVLPIITSLHPDVSVARLTSQLVGQMQESLVQAFPGSIEVHPSSVPDTADDIGRALQSLSEVLRRAPKLRGFLLFVDGLHKTEAYLKQSLEFLSQLQTLQERFELRGIKLGVLVAGSNRWETELRSNPSLSGSFSEMAVIPPLSEDQAVEAVIRRIRSFTPATASPPSIVRAPLRIAFQVLAQRLLHPPTFRDYLDHVRERFVAREYSGLGVSLKLHTETVSFMNSLILKSPLAESYRFLVDPARHSTRLKDGLRKVLPEVCARKGVREDDPFFTRFIGVFWLLRRQGWITQRVDATNKKPSWHLSPEVVTFLETAQQHKIIPTEALEALFTDVKAVAPTESESIYGPLVRQMEAMVANWRTGIPEVASLVDQALGKVRSLDEKCKTAGMSDSVDVHDEILRSAVALIRAINIGALGQAIADTDPVDVLAKLWCAPENLDGMLQTLRRTPTFSPSKPESLGLLLAHAQSLGDLCELLTSLLRGEGVCRLGGRRLTPADAERLHSARTAFLGQQYQGTVDQLCEIIEGKIRDVLYLSLRCARGDRAITFLPPDLRDRLKEPPRGHPRARRPSDRNFLFDLSRSEYSKVLFNAEVREQVLRTGLPKEEVDGLKNETELLFSLADREAHRDRPSYFREHATEISSVLQSTPRLCEMLNMVAGRIVAGSDFSLHRRSDGVDIIWDGSEKGAAHRLDPVSIQALVAAVLERLEADSFTLPPFETPLASIYPQPELGIGMIRACAQEGLVDLQGIPFSFGYRVSMTDRGRARLEAIRRTATKPPGSHS